MKSGGRKSTIYDIATAASVSPTTVSLVLNGHWKEHRIKPETAAMILRCAGELGYAVNQKARALRLSRSGLVGMILPHYRNRFFADLAESFEAEARHRDLCPIVVSTQRDPAIEARITETLLSQQVEYLFITGVHDPSPLNDMCAAAGIRCINVDLPGSKAPSVISDNRGGAMAATVALMEKLQSAGMPIDEWFFVGGFRDDHSTRQRIDGFLAALADRGIHPGTEAFRCEGYSPAFAERALAERYAQLGRLPAGLFVNGITGLEGVIGFIAKLPREAWQTTKIAAFDWDPFADHMPFDVTMVHQDVDAMIAASFELIDDFPEGEYPCVLIPTTFR